MKAKFITSFVFSLLFFLLSNNVCAQPQPPRDQKEHSNQPGHGPGEMRMPSPYEMAKFMTDMMQRDVRLDAKQYKSLYKLFVKDFKFIQKVRSIDMPPAGGGGPAMGGHGGASGLNYGGSNGQVGGNFSADSRGASMSGNVNIGQGASMNGSVGAGSGGVGLKGGISFGGGASGGGGQGGPSSMGGQRGGGGQGGSSPMGGQHGGNPGGDMRGGNGPHGMPGGDGMEQIQFPDEYLQKEDAKLRKILSPGQYRLWREKHPFDYLSFLYRPENKEKEHRR